MNVRNCNDCRYSSKHTLGLYCDYWRRDIMYYDACYCSSYDGTLASLDTLASLYIGSDIQVNKEVLLYKGQGAKRLMVVNRSENEVRFLVKDGGKWGGEIRHNCLISAYKTVEIDVMEYWDNGLRVVVDSIGLYFRLFGYSKDRVDMDYIFKELEEVLGE